MRAVRCSRRGRASRLAQLHSLAGLVRLRHQLGCGNVVARLGDVQDRLAELRALAKNAGEFGFLEREEVESGGYWIPGENGDADTCVGWAFWGSWPARRSPILQVNWL